MNKIIIPICLSLLTFSAFSYAADDRYVSASGSDSGNTCLIKSNPCRNLSHAYGQSSLGDTVKLSAGNFPVTSTLTLDKLVDIKGGYDSSYNKRLYSTHETILSSTGNRHFLLNTGLLEWIEISGVTISGLNSSTAGTVRLIGNGAKLRLTNVSLKNNTSSDGAGGAALYLTVAGSEVEIKDSAFESNTATAGSAGAIRADAGTYLNLENTSFINNQSTGHGGAILTNGSLMCTACTFESNKAIATSNALGAAIYSNSDLTIINSSFVSNEAGQAGANIWTTGGGAIATQGSGSVSIDRSVFNNNTVLGGFGGGLLVETDAKGLLSVTNSTFIDNKAGRGGAIEIRGQVNSRIAYNTILRNAAEVYEAGGLMLNGVNVTRLTANFIAANTSNAANGKDVVDFNAGPNIIDGGYNRIGFSGSASVYRTNTSDATFTSMFDSGTSNIPTASLEDMLELSLADNGGYVQSLKLHADSPLRNEIPNDQVPFYGVGQSETYPFTSLAQAHGALKSYENYQAGVYYFDLGGSYGVAPEYIFSPSGSKFSTYVDDKGWVLVASANGSDKVAGAYTGTTDMVLHNENILTESIVNSFAGHVNQVRISAYSTGARGTFDGYSTDTDVITALVNYETLPNLGTGGDWLVTHSSTGADYFTGVSIAPKKLSEEIYHASGAAGIYWIPERGDQALLYPTASLDFVDELDLWVRSTSAVCNGSITTTDGRGLPRSDYTNPNDIDQVGEKHNCDIGAFEYNDGYKFDCYAEDGFRPDNEPVFDIPGQSINFDNTQCLGGDILNGSPRALLNSFGATHPMLIFILSLFAVYRYRKN